MEDIKLITKKELDDFIEMQERICELVELKTAELALILYDKLPEGEICEFDIEESDFEEGCIFVEFEWYCCGESSRDQFNLPFEFLYSEKYPIHYKYLHNEKQRKLNEQQEEMKREDSERKERELEDYERSEYLRLKKKYGGD